MSENRKPTYIVPHNFMNSGKIMELFYLRNLMEAIGFSFFLYILEKQTFVRLNLPASTYMFIIFLTITPVAILSFLGVHGEPLSVYLMIKIKFNRDARRYEFRIPAPDFMTTEPPKIEESKKRMQKKANTTIERISDTASYLFERIKSAF